MEFQEEFPSSRIPDRENFDIRVMEHFTYQFWSNFIGSDYNITCSLVIFEMFDKQVQFSDV